MAGIVVGQPTLVAQLRRGMFAALDQRIATRFTIPPMDFAESAAYLRHGHSLAGRTDPLFADDAVARLHRVSNGLARALNNAATAALIAAAELTKDSRLCSLVAQPCRNVLTHTLPPHVQTALPPSTAPPAAWMYSATSARSAVCSIFLAPSRQMASRSSSMPSRSSSLATILNVGVPSLDGSHRPTVLTNRRVRHAPQPTLDPQLRVISREDSTIPSLRRRPARTRRLRGRR